MGQAPGEKMADQPSVPRACKECGYVPVFASRCPVCGAEAVEQSAQTFQIEQPRNPSTYSLATLFLVMTLICVGMGAIVAAPGLGIPFVVLAVPAFARSAAARKRARAAGGSWTLGERLLQFFCSLGLMLLIAVAGVVAFQVACWSSCFGVATVAGENEFAFLTGIWVGGALGVWTIGWLLWRTWPKSGR
jgi:hypothetical protein